MRSDSTQKPNAPFTIEHRNDGTCKVIFYVDPVEKTRVQMEEPETFWEWDEYVIYIPAREGLEESIKANLEHWIAYAKQCEYDILAEEIRVKRDKLLAESDATMCLDRVDLTADPTTAMNKIYEQLTGDWAKYRQDLRDIPQQSGFPYEVIFPEKPRK